VVGGFKSSDCHHLVLGLVDHIDAVGWFVFDFGLAAHEQGAMVVFDVSLAEWRHFSISSTIAGMTSTSSGSFACSGFFKLLTTDDFRCHAHSYFILADLSFSFSSL
jgi:hypothetical protein